jgi:predicted kinase
MEVVILVGLQAAGKSSFYRHAFAGTHVLVSKDLFKNARDRERSQRLLLRAALERGASVVLDNTNATAEDRAALIEIARAHGARVIGYVLESDLRACLGRNRRRERAARVPDVALLATAKRMTPPRRAEGFDALYRVRLLGDDRFEVTPLAEADEEAAPPPS